MKVPLTVSPLGHTLPRYVGLSRGLGPRTESQGIVATSEIESPPRVPTTYAAPELKSIALLVPLMSTPLRLPVDVSVSSKLIQVSHCGQTADFAWPFQMPPTGGSSPSAAQAEMVAARRTQAVRVGFIGAYTTPAAAA